MKDKKSPKPVKTDPKKREKFEENQISDKELNITDRDIEIALDSIKRETKIIVDGEKMGLKTFQDEIILPPLFDNVCLLSHHELKKGDKVVARMKGKYGVVLADGTGTWIVKPEFDYIGYPNNLTHVCKDGKWGVLDISKGEYLISPECDKIWADHGFMFTNGIGVYEKDGKMGVVTDYGAFTEPVFEDIDGEPEDWVKVRYQGQWGFINENNEFTTVEDEADYRYSVD